MRWHAVAIWCVATAVSSGGLLHAQEPTAAAGADRPGAATPDALVRRALGSNRELAAARLDVERGRARLRQAGLRPNPTLDVEHTTGQVTGSPEERELSVGIALPLEVGGRRQGRIDLATAELAALEADVANRERELIRTVLGAYVDALAAAREVEITDRLYQLDDQMVRVVRTRVEEKDAPPLELNLLLTEAARLDARRALLRGRAEAARIRLAQLVGAPEEVIVPSAAASFDTTLVPATLEAAVAMALDRRADITLARLNQRAAEAGVRLANAEGWPELTVSAAYKGSRGISDLPSPLTALPDSDHVVAFGASIGLPFLNKNQGARAEAAVAVRQAQLRRELAEQTVRAEVTAAFRRAEAARVAVAIFEQRVTPRADDNLRVMRAAYDLGEFRVSDLINEQRRVLEGQQEYSEALSERSRAIVDLRSAIGLLGGQP